MNHLTVSYLTLRRAIGVLAILFPFILIIGGMLDGTSFETSLSAYHWTNVGSLFTGMLITFSVFLFCYNGYDWVDRLITSLSALAMLAVALFPVEGGGPYLFSFVPPKATAVIHYASAFLTFAMMGVMSIVQFTRSGGTSTGKKARRNRVYRICGVLIFLSLVALFVVQIVPQAREKSDSVRLWFWLESLVLWTFGFSWLVKGQALLAD